MKRKAQTAEFRPPMQRCARISRRNSRENASSRETAEIQSADTNQISATVTASVQSAALSDNSEEHQPQCSPQLDSDLVEIHSGLDKANEPNAIKHKLQDGLTSDSNIKHPEGAGMEECMNVDEDMASPERQTSDEAHMKLVNLEDVSGAIAVPAKACEETECLKSPPKKRLRRRMGMCGLGERKRRFLIEGEQCRQSPTEAKMEESAEATGKESGDVLKCIDDGPALLNDEETTESVFLEENHSSLQQMMTEGASSAQQEIQDIQDLPLETSLKSDHHTETAVSANEPNLQECRTPHNTFSEPSTVIAESHDDVEMQYGPTGHDMEVRSMAQKGLPEEEYPDEEEANYGCTDVTDEDSNKGSKEVPEKLIFGLLGVTNEVFEGSEETANQQVAEKVTSGCSSVASEVFEASTSAPVDVAEKINYSSSGTYEVPVGSNVNAEFLVEAEVHHGSTYTGEILKSSPEKHNDDSTNIEEVVTHVTDCVCEGSTEGSIEQIEHLVDEALIIGSTNVTADLKGSPEPIEHPCDEAVIYRSGSVIKVCESSEDPTEYASEVVEDDENDGSAAVINNDCESSIQANKLFPVADRGIYSSAGVTEACESSRKPTELTVQITEEVTNGPIYFIKFCEGSKEWTDPPVEPSVLESYGSAAVTDIVSEDCKEIIGHPPQMTEEVSYASTAIANEVSEGSREQIENPDQLAKKESYGSTSVTNEVCEGSTEPTEHPVQLAKEVSYNSAVVTNEVSEGSKEPAEHLVQVAEDVSYSPIALANKACESSKELSGPSTINYFSEGSTERNENPVRVDKEENYGSKTVANEASECSKELTNHVALVDKNESYVSTAFTDKASEGSLELTGCTVKAGEEESYGCTVITIEGSNEGSTSKGSTEWTGHPPKVAEEESFGFTAVSNEVSDRFRKSTKHSIQVVEDESYGSNSVPKEASESSRELTKHSVQVAKEESYGSTAIANKASEGSLELTGHPAQVAEEEGFGCTAITDNVHEGSPKVSMEVQEALTALEEMELDGNCPPDDDLSTVEQDPRGLQLIMQTTGNSKVEPVWMEHTDYGLTASTEAAFSEICETESQFEHVELTQKPTTAAGMSTEPGGKCRPSTEGLSGPKAPSTDQEEFVHDLLSQGVCDLPATPAVAKLQPVYHPTLPLAFTEFSQDHSNIPSSLYSVTDSQLNSITLGMELDDRPSPASPEGFVHHEDATELVCGLIKELSSLNCIVMAAHKEMEVLRRGNRPPKAPTRRSYGLRNSEI